MDRRHLPHVFVGMFKSVSISSGRLYIKIQYARHQSSIRIRNMMSIARLFLTLPGRAFLQKEGPQSVTPSNSPTESPFPCDGATPSAGFMGAGRFLRSLQAPGAERAGNSGSGGGGEQPPLRKGSLTMGNRHSRVMQFHAAMSISHRCLPNSSSCQKYGFHEPCGALTPSLRLERPRNAGGPPNERTRHGDGDGHRAHRARVGGG